MTKRETTMFAEPNPVEWISLSDEEIPMYRRMNCKYYSKCLLFAARRRWLGFSCKECKKGEKGER